LTRASIKGIAFFKDGLPDLVARGQVYAGCVHLPATRRSGNDEVGNMLSNSRMVRIEWGDCDPAGIIFYPRYFAMFDHSTTMLITAASGVSKAELFKKYDFGGYPLVQTQAKFIQPTRFGDDVIIQSTFTRVGRSSFEIRHQIRKNNQICVEGLETRAWVKRDPADKDKIKSHPLPEELAAGFKAEL
jgi:4-hydroxybenzoyl-CoA thioesterase